jgi:uncharacterized protein (TIGR03083 family)
MTPTVQQTVDGFLTNLDDFATLIRTVDADRWEEPTRCEGWTIAEIAAHVAGSVVDVLNGRVEIRGVDPDAVVSRQATERRGWSGEEIAGELIEARAAAKKLLGTFAPDAWGRAAPGDFPGTLRQGVHALWFDAFLHADDIRSALGRDPDRGPGLRAGLEFVAEMLETRGGVALTLALDGTDVIEIAGGGQRVTGDPFMFLRAAKGRIDPADIGLDASINVNWASPGA